MCKNCIVESTKRFLLFFIPIISIAAVLIFINTNKDRTTEVGKGLVTIRINGAEVLAEVARTPEELAKGLSGRESLEENHGMLFYLEKRKVATFWMKGMQFPLDIIWIDNEKIIHIDKNAGIPEAGNTPSFTSPQAVTHVLEVNAGFAEESNIEVGNRVDIVE